MTFGLKNAPGTIQRAVDILLANVKWHFSLVYPDDIIIYCSSVADHNNSSSRLFPDSTTRWPDSTTPQVLFISGVAQVPWDVTQPGSLTVAVKPREEIEQTLPLPPKTQVRAFLGLGTFYHRFIPRFSKFAGAPNRKSGERSTGKV